MAIYNQNTNFGNEERYLKKLLTSDNIKEANWAKNELSKLYESAGLSGQEKDWGEGAKNRTAADKAGRDKQNGLLSKGSKDVNAQAAGYQKGQIPGQNEMRDIYGTVTGVKRPSHEQENRDQGRNSREENFDIRKAGLNRGFDRLGREAAANELTPDEQRLIETIFAAAEQVRQEKKAGNTQEGNGLFSDNSSSGKTITRAVENDNKTGSGRGVAGQDIEVRATNLSQGNSVDYDNTTGDITIVTDEGYKTVLKKGKDYYIGSDNKAYYINNPSMAVETSGGQDNDWQFSEDGTKLTNKQNGYVLEEGKDYYTGSDGIPYYYSDVRASNAAKGTGVDYDPKGKISLNYIDGSSDLLREGEQYYIGADGKAHYFNGPPSPNPDGIDDDDGDPLWLVDNIFEGWDEEDDEIPYAPYNDDDDDDWGDVLEDDDLPKWDDGRDEEDGGEDSGTLKDGDLKYLKLSSGDNGNANVNNNQDVEVVSSNQSQGNSVVLDRGRIYIYTKNNRKIELVEGKDYYYKNGTAYYYNQPYNAVAYRLGQGNIQFNKSAVKGQSTITVKRSNQKDYTLYEGKDYYIGSDNKAYFYSNVRSVNEAAGNSVTAPGENGIAIETDDGRVTNTEDYYIGKDGKAYYLYGPPAPYGDSISYDYSSPFTYVDRNGKTVNSNWTISDEEFLDSNALTQEQITEIIRKHNPKLIELSVDVIIYQACKGRINPKVILATLAQEQSWGRNGNYDKLFGIGLEGHPKSYDLKDLGGLGDAIETYLKWFNQGNQLESQGKDLIRYGINSDNKLKGTKAVFGSDFDNWANTYPEYIEYLENGQDITAVNAAMYAKLYYTPWVDFPPQNSHPLEDWQTIFRSFE